MFSKYFGGTMSATSVSQRSPQLLTLPLWAKSNDRGENMDEYVTQADREAAADILQYYHGYANLVRAGEVDAHKVVQIVAAHRRTTVAKLEGAVLPILRRHKVAKRCFAEVAAATNAILVGKEQ
jgi:hypothetical protein